MISQYKNIIAALIIIAVGTVGFLAIRATQPVTTPIDLDPTPRNVTLSGTFGCLPHLDTTGPQTLECAFGFKTDDGVNYAVNFGASANAMEQFQSGAHVTAQGFVVIKEALNTDQWQKYNMKGIFTITKIIDPAQPSARLNIDVVCKSALAYMSFPDGASADAFVQDCKDGKHPEVIERYKKDMNLGDGATI